MKIHQKILDLGRGLQNGPRADDAAERCEIKIHQLLEVDTVAFLALDCLLPVVCNLSLVLRSAYDQSPLEAFKQRPGPRVEPERSGAGR